LPIPPPFQAAEPTLRRFGLFLLSFLLITMRLCAAAPADTSARIEEALSWAESTRKGVFRDAVSPRWLPEGHRFWYGVDTGPSAREFVLVDAASGLIQRGPDLASLGLPPTPETTTSSLAPRRRPARTRDNGPATSIDFINTTPAPVRLFWIDGGGEKTPYGELAPGERINRPTYAGHAWLIEDASGLALASVVADDSRQRIVIDGPASAPVPEESRRPPSDVSPDGRWSVRLRDHNVFLHDPAAPADTPDRALTSDGTADRPYTGTAAWSPDSRAFVLTRVTRVPVRQITIVESSPTDQLQPRTRNIDYIKPGDPLPDPTPVLFQLPASSADALLVRPIDRALCPTFFTHDGDLDYRWSADSREVFFDYNQRGHQLYRILAIDALTAAVRTVVEERAEAFVDYTNKTWRHWLPGDRQLLWLSERDGFAHLWLYDTAAGAAAPRQLTRGDWVVRKVDHVDSSTGRIWFLASGLRPGEDPYYLHLCRVNFDGTGFIQLTGGEGTHRVVWSPDRGWFVDTWSRVDQAPVTELRRADDGGLVATLETADASALLATGWLAPERFTAPGRDGVTPIHGVIIRPPGFDPSRRYPVLEEIYAGPHDAFAPKSFGFLSRQQALARLGFVVVQLDGMGTNHRGRAFHAVAWKNLQDAGFPDRIAWLKAAAAARPWMDLSRVGIYGGSAGGQSAMRALLDHADFYSAAVADCGCHDNRMDKIWWNEQWLGWPLDESYIRASNTEDAARLRGHLLLVVGEQDTNVDPASTLQVVDRLIRAGKNFEFLLIPGAGHGAGETPYGQRRRLDFFLRHLSP
jgi:dipeptidyl aminopeptidase/acylaminoacyl peptidase